MDINMNLSDTSSPANGRMIAGVLMSAKEIGDMNERWFPEAEARWSREFESVYEPEGFIDAAAQKTIKESDILEQGRWKPETAPHFGVSYKEEFASFPAKMAGMKPR
ncbi:MAG: hypothetical protein ING19_08585 [Azospirillum sp.]|nr:hypothetical protein [Azospirillum sp.]